MSKSLTCWFIRFLLLGLFFVACDSAPGTEPPLHAAAFRGDAEAVEALLKAGVAVDSINGEGATPLHWAAFKGHVDVAKVLLSRGANVNAQTKKRSTPLRLAKTHGKTAMFRFLESRGGVIE